MSVVKAVKFGCPNCEEAVQIDYLVYNQGELQLAAQCPKCKAILRFDLNHAIASLFDGALAPTKGGKPS